jgi:hypothetical protein
LFLKVVIRKDGSKLNIGPVTEGLVISYFSYLFDVICNKFKLLLTPLWHDVASTVHQIFF